MTNLVGRRGLVADDNQGGRSLGHDTPTGSSSTFSCTARGPFTQTEQQPAWLPYHRIRDIPQSVDP